MNLPGTCIVSWKSGGLTALVLLLSFPRMPALTVELPSHESLTAQNLARWAEILADPRLARLEQRIETDRFGHVIMSPPPSAHHGSYQFRIGMLLNQQMQQGRVITECPISTADGVKAADVVWASTKRIRELGEQPVFPHAPDICVEVFSPGNTEAELRVKTALYFDAGAAEVWHCSADGRLTFLAGPDEVLRSSRLCPGFPREISL